MLRTVPSLLAPALLLLGALLFGAVAVAPAAEANGILTTGSGIAPPVIAHRRHPRPTRIRIPVVRLKGHSVKAELSDRIASVTVEQVFHNHSGMRLEGTYLFPLPEDEGTIELRYPLATHRLNATPVESVTVDVKVKSSVDIKTIYSPSHNVEVRRDGERTARVTYERSGRNQEKDLLLYVGRSPDAVGFSLQSHKEAGRDGAFMAVFAPRTHIEDKDRVPKDVVYVIDKSGSMAGPKMEQARKAISYGVRLLREGDRFNVIAFSTNIYPFRDSLMPASTEMKEAAVKHVAGLQPSGGTNIDGALRAALKMRADNRLFMVVFITDGKPTVEVLDPQTIVKNVKAANSQNTRIFTFGVGFDLDVNLLDRLAEVTNGTRDYVTPGEDLEVVTGRFFRKVDQPVLTDVRVELGTGVYDVYPKRLPDLFAGSQIVLFGRYKAAGARTVILRGRIGRREIVYEHNTTLSAKDEAPHLPRLWASRKIAYLLDEIRLHGQNKELIDEVVQLATRHAIVTPYTAGLVVEETEMAGRPLDEVRDGRRRWRAGAPKRKADRSLGGLVPGGPAPAPQPGTGIGGGAGGRTAPAPTTPAPRAEGKSAADSETLRRLKEAAAAEEPEGETDADDFGAGYVRALIKAVAGKTFIKRADGRWTDKAWDGKKATTKVEVYSEAYFKLLTKNKKIAKYLALGEKVVFVLGEIVYEVIPAK